MSPGATVNPEPRPEGVDTEPGLREGLETYPRWQVAALGFGVVWFMSGELPVFLSLLFAMVGSMGYVFAVVRPALERHFKGLGPRK